MSSPVSTAPDASATISASAAGSSDAAPLDGWRSGELPVLRAELDRIDDAVHDLLMHRAEVVEHVARSGKPAAFRPGREASIIRRLLSRHRGALPPVALVRIWRELLAGTTAMQGRFTLAVCDAGHGALLTHLAHEHFGVLTPLHEYQSAADALAAVGRGAASVAVLPYPSETDTWWAVLPQHEPRLHIIARLPFWAPRPDGASITQALVVASTEADASGQDRSILGLACGGEVDKVRLTNELAAMALTPDTLVTAPSPGSPQGSQNSGSPMVNVFADVAGTIHDGDPRLRQLAQSGCHAVVLGTYAVPFAGVSR